jgi:hypothetical protein
MAVKRKLKLNQINGVAAGATATITLPTSVRYHTIYLKYGTDTSGGATEANMETEITEIRCNINGTTQWRLSAAQLFDINRAMSLGAPTAGYLPLHFSLPVRRTPAAREATAWGMRGVTSFQIEVDIANNSSQSATLAGFAVVDDVQEPPLGIIKYKPETIQVSATGELTHKLETARGDSYAGLFFFEATDGDIDNVLIKRDGLELFNLTEADIPVLLANSDYTDVTKLVHVAFDDNNPVDAVPTVNTDGNGNVTSRVDELLATLTMGGAANVTVVRQLLGRPD